MLKRNLLILGIVLGLAPGMLQYSPAKKTDSFAFELPPPSGQTISATTARNVLKLAAPQFRISFGQAESAYAHGYLTIVADPALVDNYQVDYGGLCIFILLEDAYL